MKNLPILLVILFLGEPPLSSSFQDSFFVFGLWQFCYNRSQCGSLNLSYLDSVELIGFVDLNLFSNFGDFQLYFSNNLSAPLSLSSPSENPIVHIWSV